MLSKECYLYTFTLSDLDFFCLSISFVPSDIPDSASLSAIAIIDSGSSHFFIDSSLIKSTLLCTHSILPVPLQLFDGSQGKTIIKVVHEIFLHFLSGNTMPLTFYITPLDFTCLVVLGYSWLTCYNLGINWVLRHITFRITLQGESSLISTDSPACMAAASASPTPLKLSVFLISAAAFLRASKLGGSQSFCIQLSNSSTSTSAHKATLDKGPPDLSTVPSEYHDFADIFSKSQTNILASYYLYNLKIHLDKETALPWGLIYSLSQAELHALHDFIDKNVKTEYIRSSCFSHGAPILFICKKDSSLQLCIDYRGLNKISQKDKYLLPLLTDLLDAPQKARIYTKIDLRYAYHLVRIADGDKWKTTFRTYYGSFK